MLNIIRDIYHWISIHHDVLTTIASWFIVYTLIIARKQLKADHERSRRELAVNLILNWTKSIEPSTTRKFVERLDEGQSNSLLNFESFTINGELLPLLEGCLEKNDFNEIKTNSNSDSNSITIPAHQVTKIRGEMVSYLNILEAILATWRHNVADRTIIEEEFKYLIIKSDVYRYKLVPKFIEASGNAYPAIIEFSEHLENISKISRGKGPIDKYDIIDTITYKIKLIFTR